MPGSTARVTRPAFKVTIGGEGGSPGTLCRYCRDGMTINEIAVNPIATQSLDALSGEGEPVRPGGRVNHARGVVLSGTFVASPEAAGLSAAFHLQGLPIAATVRFSHSSGNPDVAENSREANPRGMAIRFATLAEPALEADLVAHSVDCFPARTPEDFLAFLSVLRAAERRPEAFERYLAMHPEAKRFVSAPMKTPRSFATERYYALHAVELVDAGGRGVAGRFEIEPVAGVEYLTSEEAAAASGRFLSDDIAARVAAGGIEMSLCFKFAEPGDALDDISVPWPAQRRKAVLGTLRLDKTITDPEVSRNVSFDPSRLTPGVASAGDPMLPARRDVYASAVERRRQAHRA